jgi:hypothetical protein
MDDLSAAESQDAIKMAIVNTAMKAGPVHGLAFIVLLAAIWLPPWSRWIAGFAVLACLLLAFRLAKLFALLGQASRFHGFIDIVGRRHRLMNLLAIALLAYAFMAVWGRWPLPALAVFASYALHYAHFAGYKDSVRVK